MRLQPALMLASLLALLPSISAIPVVDEGPQAFVYEPMVAEPDLHVSVATVAVKGEKTAVAWLGIHPSQSWDGVHAGLLVREGGISHRLELPFNSAPAGVFDGQGRFHAAVVESHILGGAPPRAHAYTFDGSAWTSHELIGAGSDFFYAPLAMEHDGVPYLVFNVRASEDRAHVFRLNSQTDQWELWTILPEDAVLPMGAMDSQGRLHLVYHSRVSPNYDQERYAVFDGNTWTLQNAPFNAASARAFAVATGPGDKPYFVYHDYAKQTRLVSPSPSGGFQDELVSTSGTWSTTPRITVDDAGTVSILCTFYTGNFDMPTGQNAWFIRKFVTGQWQWQPVLPVSFQFQPDMVEDDEGRPVIGLPNGRLQTVVRTDDPDIVDSIVVARPAQADRHPAQTVLRALG